jgi:hypothetical protein
MVSFMPPNHFSLGEGHSCTHWTRAWVCPRTSQDTTEEKNKMPLLRTEPWTLTNSPDSIVQLSYLDSIKKQKAHEHGDRKWFLTCSLNIKMPSEIAFQFKFTITQIYFKNV